MTCSWPSKGAIKIVKYLGDRRSSFMRLGKDRYTIMMDSRKFTHNEMRSLVDKKEQMKGEAFKKIFKKYE